MTCTARIKQKLGPTQEVSRNPAACIRDKSALRGREKKDMNIN
jgi:hypothetical protein